MAIRLVGTDGGNITPGQSNPGAVSRINPSDFRGVAYQVEAQLLDAEYELKKNQIINAASTRRAVAARQGATTPQTTSEGSGGSQGTSRGSGEKKPFDPSMDVSEREKFQENVFRDRRDYATGRFDNEQKRADTERKEQAALQKELQSERSREQYAAAQQEVEEATASLQEMLRSGGGMSQVRSALSSIIAKYPELSADAKRDLVKQVYSPAQEVIKEQIKTTQDKIKEVQGYNRTTMLQQQRLKFQGLTVALESATGAERQRILGGIETAIGSIAKDERLDPVDKAFMVSQLTTDVVENARGGAELANLMNRYDGYIQEAAQLHTRRAEVSPQQYAYEESRLITKYGLQGTSVARLDDPYRNEKKILETERLMKDIRQFRTESYLDNKYGIQAERGAIGDLARGYATPAGVEALKAYASRNGNPPGMMQAVKVAQGLVEFRRDYATTQGSIAQFNKEIALLQSSTAQQVLSMMTRGKEDVTTMAIFSQLSPGIQSALQQSKGLTPEQQQEFVQQYVGLRQQAVRYAEQQRNALSQSLNIRRQELELYVGNDAFAAFESVKQNAPQIRQQVQKKPVGVSPQRSNAQWANEALQSLPQSAPAPQQQVQPQAPINPRPMTAAERMNSRMRRTP